MPSLGTAACLLDLGFRTLLRATLALEIVDDVNLLQEAMEALKATSAAAERVTAVADAFGHLEVARRRGAS